MRLEDLTQPPPDEPTFEDWEALPVAGPDDTCPNCGGRYFGTTNPLAYLLIRRCHGDDDRPPCGTLYRRRPDPWQDGLLVASIIGRLLGYRQRYIVDRAENARRYGLMVIELSHPSDPRFLLVDELPERVRIDDLGSWRYGKPLLFPPGPVDAVYPQPEGFGTDWVRPSA